MKWQHKPSNAKPVPLPNREYLGEDGWTYYNGYKPKQDSTLLTENEIDRLTVLYGHDKFDRVRAKRVSDLMKEKKSVRQIAATLKHYGRGYSLRTITPIHAALNPSPIKAVGEGLKKRSNSPTATRKVNLII